jgi:predicted phosphodiesterase
LGNQTIAKYILYQYGGTFDYNLEKIRSAVRYRLGKNGEQSRNNAKEIIERTTPPKMPKTWNRDLPPYDLSPGLWLLLYDIHVPFHEPRAIEAAIQYGQAQKVDGVLLPGDSQDCAAVSFWPSIRRRDFDGEVELFIDMLDLLLYEFKGKRFVYKPGNHEYRLPRYYAAKAPELIGMPLLAMEHVLGFEHRGIEFLDYNQKVMAGKLPIIHGHETKSTSGVNPARGLFLKTFSWAMCGHFHRTSEHTSTNIRDEYLTTWSVGCLCNLKPEYNPFGNSWNHGVA